MTNSRAEEMLRQPAPAKFPTSPTFHINCITLVAVRPYFVLLHDNCFYKSVIFHHQHVVVPVNRGKYFKDAKERARKKKNESGMFTQYRENKTEMRWVKLCGTKMIKNSTNFSSLPQTTRTTCTYIMWLFHTSYCVTVWSRVPLTAAQAVASLDHQILFQ